MKILVCGSRNWEDRYKIVEVFAGLVHGSLEPITIIHGAAKGADQLAGTTAKEYGLEVEEYPADWDKYGRRAGPIRNLEMLDQEPDLVLAFQVGKSRGTQHTIDHARKRGIPVKVYKPG